MDNIQTINNQFISSSSEDKTQQTHNLTTEKLKLCLSRCKVPADHPGGEIAHLQTLMTVFDMAKKISRHEPWKQIQPMLEQASTQIQTMWGKRIASARSAYAWEIIDQIYSKDLVKEHNKQMKKYIGTSPIWSTLGLVPINSKHRDAFVLLQAQILVCLSVFEKPEHLGFIKKAFLAVSDLATKKGDTGLSELSIDSVAPEVFLQRLRDLPRHNWMTPVEILIESAMDLLDVYESIFDDDDVAETGDELEDNDLDRMKRDPLPEEDFSGDDFEVGAMESEQDVQPVKKKERPLKAARPGKALAKANQLFRYSWNRLSRKDVHDLLKAFQSDVKSQEERLELLLVQLMFWTGSDEHRLAKILCGWPEHFENDQSNDVYDINFNTLYVFSPYPILKYPPEGSWQIARRINYMPLSLPSMCLKVLNDYVAGLNISQGEILFNESHEEIKQRGQIWLTRMKKESRNKYGPESLMTLKRIQKHLPMHSSRINGGDSAVTNLMLGRDDFLGRTKAHYLSLSPRRLQRHYEKTISSEIYGKYVVDAGGQQND